MNCIKQTQKTFPVLFLVILIPIELTTSISLVRATTIISISENRSMFKSGQRTIAQVEYNPPANGAEGLTSVRDIPIAPSMPFDNESERLRNDFSDPQLLQDDRNVLPEIIKNCPEESTILLSYLHPLSPDRKSCGKAVDWIENQNPTDVINSEINGARTR